MSIMICRAKNIFKYAKLYGNSDPVIMEEDIFKIIISTTSGRDTEQVTPGKSQPESQPESKLAIRVLLILQKSELSKSEISQELGQKQISGELKKQIVKLLEQGLIERTIPEKPNSRLQKYRLTHKGLELLNKGK